MVETNQIQGGWSETQCQQCGTFVSAQFARVFGDNNDLVHGCHECMSTAELLTGGSVTPD